MIIFYVQRHKYCQNNCDVFIVPKFKDQPRNFCLLSIFNSSSCEDLILLREKLATFQCNSIAGVKAIINRRGAATCNIFLSVYINGAFNFSSRKSHKIHKLEGQGHQFIYIHRAQFWFISITIFVTWNCTENIHDVLHIFRRLLHTHSYDEQQIKAEQISCAHHANELWWMATRVIRNCSCCFCSLCHELHKVILRRKKKCFNHNSNRQKLLLELCIP